MGGTASSKSVSTVISGPSVCESIANVSVSSDRRSATS